MPRQANGVYLQPANTAGGPAGTVISSAEYNSLDIDIGNEITASLDRYGRGAMLTDLDVGTFRVKNVASATTGKDAVNRDYLFGAMIVRVGATGGTADAITGTFNPTINGYFTGLTVKFVSIAANATTTTTFKVDSLAAKQIFRRGGLNIGIADIPAAGYWVQLTYDASLAGGAGGWSLTAINSFPIRSVSQQGFTNSGTYFPSNKMVACLIECWGGGGGGGNATNSSGFGSGGGGGAGSYARKFATAAVIGASKAVTIGIAGAVGGAGGTTSVGTICIATGGGGGFSPGAGNSAGGGGAGGVGGTGDETFNGSNGCPGMAATTNTGLLSGSGGGTSIGNGGWGVSGTTAGSAPSEPNSGAGGSGGASQGGGGFASGNAGAKGYVRITEYIS